MTMRERIARALWQASTSLMDKEAMWEAMKPFDSQHYFELADAVLAAMREPTEEMLEAAKPEPVHLYGKDGRDAAYERKMKAAVQADRASAAYIWRTMIDAAVSGGQVGV